jgi:transcriptional regulator with XRE-family HTH domain
MSTEDANKIIAGNIRAEMARAGVSQTDIARAIGLPQAAVSRRVRGITPWLAGEVVIVASQLGVSTTSLVPDTTTTATEAGAA